MTIGPCHASIPYDGCRRFCLAFQAAATPQWHWQEVSRQKQQHKRAKLLTDTGRRMVVTQ